MKRMTLSFWICSLVLLLAAIGGIVMLALWVSPKLPAYQFVTIEAIFIIMYFIATSVNVVSYVLYKEAAKKS